jgi:hypothetical protein
MFYLVVILPVYLVVILRGERMAIAREARDDDFTLPVKSEKVRDLIPSGHHPGHITGLRNLGKVTRGKWTKDRMVIVVELEDDLGGVEIEFNKILTPGSHLRMALEKLGVIIPNDGVFDVRQIVGMEVEVFVNHVKGNVRGVFFARVYWNNIGKRRAKVQSVAEVIE